MKGIIRRFVGLPVGSEPVGELRAARRRAPAETLGRRRFELGQPLHAFDAQTLKTGVIGVSPAIDGEKFTTLDNIERVLVPNDLLIRDGERGIALAGVMGGLETEVTDKRESKSRPGEGIVTFSHVGRNQHGDVVATASRKTMVRKRPDGAA